MTRSKLEGRRLDWPPGRVDEAAVLGSARFCFLCTAAELHSDLTASLAKTSTETDLEAWGMRWHLSDPWCLELARESRKDPIVLGRHFTSGGVGGWTADLVPAKPLSKHPAHFRWLAQYQLTDTTYAAIAGKEHATTQTVAEACSRLAKLLGLTLRPAQGRPKPIS